MDEKITILQISDLHAGVGMASPSRNEGDQLPALYHHLHETLPDLKKRHGFFHLVVFNGDFVDLGETDNFPNVRKRFIAPLIDELDPEMVIAVPGNHDVNGADLKNDRGLGQFISVFGSHPKGSLACNPLRQDGPVFTHPNGKVQIWPVNSAYLARKTDPDWDYFIDPDKIAKKDSYPWRIDPAYVNPDHMDKCSSALHGDSFRIAVIHHNPIPCPGEGSEDGKMKKYRFVNDGDFNRFLAQREFHLVLHGHQHIPRLSHYSPYSDWLETYSKKKEQLSYLDCGFLTVGAPTFGYHKNLGFNVIELEIADSLNIVITRVYQYTIVHNSPKETSKSTVYLPIKPLRDDIADLLSEVTYKACSSEEGFRQLQEFIRPKKEETLFDLIRRIRTKIVNIRGVYSVSVFSPKLWGTKNLADLFLPVGKRNIAYGVALAKRNEFHLHKKNKALKNRLNKGHPSLYFSFSDPLCDAIENALSISQKLKVAARLRDCLKSENFRADIELPQLDFLQRCFGPSKKNAKDVFNSLSIWDNAGRIPVIDTRYLVKNKPKENELNKIVQAMTGLPNIGEMRVTMSRLGGTPRFNFGKRGSARRLVESLFEFPRILIWDDASFDDLRT